MGRGRAIGLAIVATTAVVLSLLPGTAGRAQADTFSGTAGGACDASPVTVFSFPLDGTVSYLEVVQTRVAVEAGAIVKGYWILSNGATPGFKYWQGPGTFFSWYGDGKAGSQYLRVNLVQGTTGTARFVMVKTGSYGGCFSVSNTGVKVVRYASGGGGGGGGVATPTPSPSGASPTPTTPATTPEPSPSGYPSASPPEGWCWFEGSGATPWVLGPCEQQTPAPEPCNTWVAYTVMDGTIVRHWWKARGCGGSGSAADGQSWALSQLVTAPPQTYTGMSTMYILNNGGLVKGGAGKWAPGFSVTAPAFSTAIQGGSGWVPDNASFEFVNTSWTQTFDIWIRGTCGWGACSGSWTSGGDAAGGWTVWIGQPITGGVRPWTLSPTADPTPTPSVTPSPTLPPSFAPSLPPPPADTGLSPATGFDVCDPAYSAADRALCATPDPTASIGGASADPDAVGHLLDTLHDKAPFGYGYQAVEALEGGFSGAGGAGLQSCYTFAGPPDISFCLPLEEVSAALSPFRSAFLAMITIVFAVGLIRAAQRATGSAGSASGA